MVMTKQALDRCCSLDVRILSRALQRAIISHYVYPLALLCLGLVAFVLRLHRLDVQSLRGDEILGAIAVQGPFGEMFNSVALVDHPPLFFLLLRCWIAIAGSSDFAIRFPSVGFSTLTVLVVSQIGRRLFGRSVALLAGFIAAISPLGVVYGQEARAYALAVLFATISVYTLLLLIDRGSLRGWVLWTGFSLLTMFSEYVGGLVVAFADVLLVCLLVSGRLSGWRHWVGAHIVILTVLGTWLVLSQAPRNVYVYDSAAWGLDSVDMLRQTAMQFSVGYTHEGQLAVILTATFVGIAILGMLSRKGWNRSSFFSVGYLVVPIIMTNAFSLGMLGFAARHLLVAMPAFFLLLACGLNWLRLRSWLFFSLGLATVGAGMGTSLANYYYNPVFAREDLRAMARYIEDEARPGDLVVFAASWGEKMFNYYSDAPLKTIGLPFPDKRDRAFTRENLANAVAGHDRVWLALYNSVAADPDGDVEGWLTEHTYPLGAVGFSGVTVRSFLVDSPVMSARPSFQNRVDQTFGDTQTLLGYDLGDRELARKGRLHVTLYWQSLQALNKSYRIQVRLVDGNNRVWASRDNRPVMDTLPSPQWPKGSYVRDDYTLNLLPGAPPGRYNVSVRVYDPVSTVSLSVAQGAGDVVIGQVDLPKRVNSLPPERYNTQVPAFRRFDEIELLGYGLWGRKGEYGTRMRSVVGDQITVSTLWRATADFPEDEYLTLRLECRNWTAASTVEAIGSAYSSSHWQKGEMVRDFRSLTIDPRTPEGIYRLFAEVGDREHVVLGEMRVERTTRSFDRIEMAHRLDGSFTGGIALLGYDLTPSPRPSLTPQSHFTLTLYWQTKDIVTERYTVFAHLANAKERIDGQHDSEPAQGTRPTTSWLPGEIVIDRHALTVSPDATAGVHQLYVGLYDAKTGKRISLTRGGDRLLLGELPVVRDSQYLDLGR